MRPSATDYAPSHAAYVDLVPEEEILEVMERQTVDTQKVLSSLDDTRASHRYAEGKWSIKQVLGHLVDAERVFGYRAMAIARGEKNPLPGFDENEYVDHASFDTWKLGDLVEAYALMRRSNVLFFRNLADEAWDRRGVANDSPVSVRGIAWVIVGHERHHRAVLHERYGL